GGRPARLPLHRHPRGLATPAAAGSGNLQRGNRPHLSGRALADQHPRPPAAAPHPPAEHWLTFGGGVEPLDREKSIFIAVRRGRLDRHAVHRDGQRAGGSRRIGGRRQPHAGPEPVGEPARLKRADNLNNYSNKARQLSGFIVYISNAIHTRIFSKTTSPGINHSKRYLVLRDKLAHKAFPS